MESFDEGSEEDVGIEHLKFSRVVVNALERGEVGCYLGFETKSWSTYEDLTRLITKEDNFEKLTERLREGEILVGTFNYDCAVVIPSQEVFDIYQAEQYKPRTYYSVSEEQLKQLQKLQEHVEWVKDMSRAFE